ncbi:MAG: tyrosine--tRNA ligase [Phycisphaerales bacterium]|nr:tyrosine--tRNA ligase [Phycisphaerales bacterium]
MDFIKELQWRNLFAQCTDEPALRTHLADPVKHPRRAYAGFDPTSDSLTIGNLVPIMMLVHFARAGHHPVVVMGGGTGLIGDPSGKSAERTLMTEEQVRANVDAQRPIFERVFTNADLGTPPLRGGSSGGPALRAGSESFTIVNNLDWLGPLSYLQVLRDVGKHFSVNMMIQKDSVRERLTARDQGISYTEFSYMILQSYDYLHLWREHNVTLQMGGSDQWGNIVAGGDLIRRESPEQPAFGLTAPLVTKSDGGKFGKTESGAIWLSPHRTSPYEYFQFWLNASDADAGRYLRIFTLLPRERIEEIEEQHKKDPAKRLAQRELAREATALLHGRAEAEKAEAAGKALFGGGGSRDKFEALVASMKDVPNAPLERARLDGDGLPVLDAVATPPLAASKREAREHLAAGAVSVNGEKVTPDYRLTPRDLLKGSVIALRRGKKTWLLLRVS